MNNNRTTSNVSSSIKQRANAIYLQLRQCLKVNSCGGSNKEALQEMQLLGWELKQTSIPLIAEKVASLVCSASILYSERKHARYAEQPEAGADRVHHSMLCDLVSIKSIIDHISDDS